MIVDVQNCVALFAQIVEGALPFAIVFALGTKIVDTFMSMAFGGRIKF